MSRDHIHLSEADLIQRALAGAAPSVGDPEGLDCAECHARLLELGGFLDHCRDESLRLEQSEAEPARDFAERVLARTTREDLGWRGDWSLVGRFVANRLRTSPVLRFAAASLAVHLLVLPVLAWMALREAREERVLQVRIQAPREQTLPAVPMEPEFVLVAPDLGPEPQLVEARTGSEEADWALTAGPTDEQARRAAIRDRSFLREGTAPPRSARPSSGAAPGAPPEVATPHSSSSTLARLFELRSTVLHGGRVRSRAGAGPGPSGAAGDLLSRRPGGSAVNSGLERGLLAEIMLDKWIFEGRTSPALESVLRELGVDPGLAEAERRMEVLALQRAHGYGLLDAEGRARWAALSRDLQAGPRPEGRAAWAAWAAALEACLSERPAADRAAAGAWVHWER